MLMQCKQPERRFKVGGCRQGPNEQVYISMQAARAAVEGGRLQAQEEQGRWQPSNRSMAQHSAAQHSIA